jgi:hypothetical protein
MGVQEERPLFLTQMGRKSVLMPEQGSIAASVPLSFRNSSGGKEEADHMPFGVFH